MARRKQFTFYRSFYEAINILPQEVRLGLYEALIRYALDKTHPDSLDPVQAANFILIKPVLDASWKKAMAGKLGGSKPKAKSKQTASKGEKEEEKEYEVEKENEKELENEIEDDSLYPAGFCAFWDLYPVKLGKNAALAAWKRRMPDPEEICNGVRQWLQTDQWCRQQGRFIPRAAKFIEEQHDRHLPGDHIPKGASGVLGKAELEAIEMVMREK